MTATGVGAEVAEERLGLLKWVDVRGSRLLEPADPTEADVSPLARRGMLVPLGIPSLLRGRYSAASRSWVTETADRFGVAATSIYADDDNEGR